MSSYRFVFVIEHVLGHIVHGMNLEAVLQAECDIDATILRIQPGFTPGVARIPLTSNWSLQSSWAARQALHREVRARPVDGIFIHTQVAALLATSLMRQVPTVVSLDATPLDFDIVAAPYGHRRQSALLENAKIQITRRALTGASSVVTWSEWAARSVVRDYRIPPDRVRAIYPGVELKRFRPVDRSNRSGPARVLFVGGDFVRKGGEDLVEAAASLSGLVELDLVTADLPRTMPTTERIRVHTSVRPNSEQLRQLYARADIFALPTRGDCTPLVIAEAMAAGLPIVATSIGSIPDMVRSGENGLLVPPASPGRLAEALRTLATDVSLRSRMRTINRAVAEQVHDRDRNWQEIFDIMRHASPRTSTEAPSR